VLDESRSQASRGLADAFRASGYFTLTEYLGSQDEIPVALERGRVQLVVVIPPDFADRLAGDGPARLQVLLDGSDANTATIALAYAQAVVRVWSNREGSSREETAGRGPLTIASRVWYNEELASRNMIVPGLVAVVMMVIATMLTSLTIAREWERGTMEQLAATPVRRTEVVLGKLLPYLGIGLTDVAAASLVGVGLFGVPFRGSVALLAVLSLFFLLGALGLGIFISAAARSQLLATQMSMLATFLPAFLLSGFMFAISVMPAPLQAVTYLVPARYFLVVTRGIFLKGVGIEVLRDEGLLMVAFAAAGLTLAVRTFKKRLD
jgi:ABC-2 type transport system permease protein